MLLFRIVNKFSFQKECIFFFLKPFQKNDYLEKIGIVYFGYPNYYII